MVSFSKLWRVETATYACHSLMAGGGVRPLRVSSLEMVHYDEENGPHGIPQTPQGHVNLSTEIHNRGRTICNEGFAGQSKQLVLR
jgi:hypothetical protein